MIYFLADVSAERVKIGFSTKPWSRIAKVQSDCPAVLTLLAVIDGDQAREAQLHEQFAADRVRGEWFRLSADLHAFMTAQARIKRPAPRSYRNTWGMSSLTDKDVAPLVGLSRAQVSRIRTGKSLPTLPVAIKLVELTGVTFEWLARAA